MAAQHEPYDCDDAVTTSEDVRLIPVVFAPSRDEATYLCTVLEEMNIPALVGKGEGSAERGWGGTSRMPIFVPAPLHDRAAEIIASHEASNYVDDEEEDDFFEDDEDEDFFDDANEDDEEDLDDDIEDEDPADDWDA